MFNKLLKNKEAGFFYSKVLIILFSLSSLLFANNFDKTKSLAVGIQYGYGNFFVPSVRNNYADETKFNEIVIDVEKVMTKKSGLVFLFNYAENSEKGYGACEGIPYNYNVDSKAYFASGYFYLNWKYFGFKFGLSGFIRDAGFCEEGADLQMLYPAAEIKLGLIDKAFLFVSTPNDLLYSAFSFGLKYHFNDYYSQISAGFVAAEYGFYFLKGQVLINDKIILSGQGMTSFSDNLYSFRVGVGYVFKLSD